MMMMMLSAFGMVTQIGNISCAVYCCHTDTVPLQVIENLNSLSVVLTFLPSLG